MAIVPHHIRYYDEIFFMPGVLKDPVLVFGDQDYRIPRTYFESWAKLSFLDKLRKLKGILWHAHDSLIHRFDTHIVISSTYNVDSFHEFLARCGVVDVEILDLFASGADVRFDMNQPVPASKHGRFGTLLDIGCLEHVFDTRQCMENCLRMIALGGHYVLQVPVNGYFAHGFHVFNPGGILDVITMNGFEVRYRKYSYANGRRASRPGNRGDVLLWLVARKVREFSIFRTPNQEYWQAYYGEEDVKMRKKIQENYWRNVG